MAQQQLTGYPKVSTLYPGSLLYIHPFLSVANNSEEAIIIRNANGEEVDRTPVVSDTENDNRHWMRNNSTIILKNYG